MILCRPRIIIVQEAQSKSKGDLDPVTERDALLFRYFTAGELSALKLDTDAESDPLMFSLSEISGSGFTCLAISFPLAGMVKQLLRLPCTRKLDLLLTFTG